MSPFLIKNFFIVLVFFALNACSQADPELCGEGVPRHAKHPYTHRTCPIAGRMGEFKLAIPRQYQFTEVAYKGFDLWRKETHANNPKVPTLESELDHFTVMVRRNNFKPIESDADKEDVLRFENNQKTTPLDQRWMWVNFTYQNKIGEHYPGCTTDDCPPVQAGYPPLTKWWLEDDIRRYGRLNREQQKVWGLTHYISTNPPGTESEQWQKEFWVDDKITKRILCETTLQAVAPHAPLADCQFNFKFIHPESHDVVNVRVSFLLQHKADVSDWQHIEQGIRTLFDSFIVR